MRPTKHEQLVRNIIYWVGIAFIMGCLALAVHTKADDSNCRVVCTNFGGVLQCHTTCS